ncbi:hypothetical protein [Spirosoma sp.]|uniref:hypothetical protein n=1 Tax=Spirosoma sp. TaxID=1899569 RepID=UPI002625D389|nr:hypothetical protein [Spirosoma sp.]MCX6216489.1 hypothetical protein [Spirosoma sp.]
MKRLLPSTLLRNSSFFCSTNSLLFLAWGEQIGLWVVALGVDWAKLPWAFAGATIATLKSKKDASGQPVHKPLWEFVSSALGGMVIGMAAWKDVMSFTKLSPEFSTVIAGLIGWLLADIILKKAKTQLSETVTPPKP